MKSETRDTPRRCRGGPRHHRDCAEFVPARATACSSSSCRTRRPGSPSSRLARAWTTTCLRRSETCSRPTTGGGTSTAARSRPLARDAGLCRRTPRCRCSAAGSRSAPGRASAWSTSTSTTPTGRCGSPSSPADRRFSGDPRFQRRSDRDPRPRRPTRGRPCRPWSGSGSTWSGADHHAGGPVPDARAAARPGGAPPVLHPRAGRTRHRLARTGLGAPGPSSRRGAGILFLAAVLRPRRRRGGGGDGAGRRDHLPAGADARFPYDAARSAWPELFSDSPARPRRSAARRWRCSTSTARPKQIRSTLAVLFTVGAAMSLTGIWLSGHLDTNSLPLAAAADAMPPARRVGRWAAAARVAGPARQVRRPRHLRGLGPRPLVRSLV